MSMLGFKPRNPLPQMTKRKRQILRIIFEGQKKHGFPPSYREIGDEVKLDSSSTIHSHIVALERLGAIVRRPQTPRSLRITALGLRELEETAAYPVWPSDQCCALCGQTMPAGAAEVPA